MTTNRTRRIAPWKKPDMGIRVPKMGSIALKQYFDSFRQINAFLNYLLMMASQIEHTAKAAHTALLSVTNNSTEKERLEKEWLSRKSAIDELKSHRQFLMEIILVRHVENYLNFLAELLKEIFLACPESLRSSEKIDLETVLQHSSIEDLVVTVAERKVESLTYTSFSNLAGYFDEKFHIELVPTAEIPTIVDAIETRNISVHNRCVINQRFVSRTDKWAHRIGEVRGLGIERVEEMIKVATNSVIAVDKDARKRLRVKGHIFQKIEAAT